VVSVTYLSNSDANSFPKRHTSPHVLIVFIFDTTLYQRNTLIRSVAH
jgi:hypothetical protein